MPTKSEIIDKFMNALEDCLFPTAGTEEYVRGAIFNALSEYVTFIEEGSRPQWSDIVYDSKRHQFEVCSDEFMKFAPIHGNGWPHAFKVIQRNGKPVITLQKE